jgi:hypothetical protein
MIADAQELLRLFGCPYIVSPAEAEAQCAVLHQVRAAYFSLCVHR